MRTFLFASMFLISTSLFSMQNRESINAETSNGLENKIIFLKKLAKQSFYISLLGGILTTTSWFFDTELSKCLLLYSSLMMTNYAACQISSCILQRKQERRNTNTQQNNSEQ